MMVPLLSVALATGCIAVEGDRLLAGDLAKADPAFGPVAPDTALAYAPAPGVKRILRRAELGRLAASHALTSSPSHDICVERSMLPLEQARVTEAMRRSLSRLDAVIEIVDMTHAQVPKGTIEFPLGSLSQPPATDPKAPVVWRGYVRYAGRRRFPIFARVKITVPAKRLIAITSLPAGKPILADQFRVESDPAGLLDFGLAQSPEQVIGRAPRRSVAAGQPISFNLLEAPKDVAAGDAVRVDVTGGSTHIHLEARAEAAGRRGDWILVRNIETGKRFRAQVTGPGAVEINDGRKSDK
ncbi:MAG: flagellar basal body P-ring formation chaperone FlgA [Bryobacteraceae bacterium]